MRIDLTAVAEAVDVERTVAEAADLLGYDVSAADFERFYTVCLRREAPGASARLVAE